MFRGGAKIVESACTHNTSLGKEIFDCGKASNVDAESKVMEIYDKQITKIEDWMIETMEMTNQSLKAGEEMVLVKNQQIEFKNQEISLNEKMLKELRKNYNRASEKLISSPEKVQGEDVSIDFES